MQQSLRKITVTVLDAKRTFSRLEFAPIFLSAFVTRFRISSLIRTREHSKTRYPPRRGYSDSRRLVVGPLRLGSHTLLARIKKRRNEGEKNKSGRRMKKKRRKNRGRKGIDRFGRWNVEWARDQRATGETRCCERWKIVDRWCSVSGVRRSLKCFVPIWR